MTTTQCTPSETAVSAAYQVTARWFASEQQLIWRRTALFVTLNSLVVAAVQFLPALHVALRILVPLSGAVFTVCWYFSMKRAWAYQTYLTRMLREQEGALHLGPLGAFTRALRAMHGGTGELVAGETIRIPPRHVMFNAEALSNGTIWLFFVVYMLYFFHSLLQLRVAD